MKLKVLETNLNLRIERGKVIDDYQHDEEVGRTQASFGADIICNVEDEACEDEGYRKQLKDYRPIFGMEDSQQRGNSVYVRSCYKAEKITVMTEPHLLHVKIYFEEDHLNLLVLRILVSDGSQEDFKDRKKQFEKVVSYLESLEDKHNIILTGDWNHGVINDNGIYKRDAGRYYFDYQYIVSCLSKHKMSLAQIKGYSFKGYMRIDHMAVSDDIRICKIEYVDVFKNLDEGIGIPDHKPILAEIELSSKGMKHDEFGYPSLLLLSAE